MTFIGPGLLYEADEVIHMVVLDRLVIGSAWDRGTRSLFEKYIETVDKVLSCVARVDRQGELSITVSALLSEKDHWEVLRNIVTKLAEMKPYGGEIDKALPTVLPTRLLV